MELLKFRIVNYKSIKDSGECYLNPTLTILAGMNESGKSSLLEALRDFSPNKTIEVGGVRIDEIGEPEINLWFKFSDEDVFNIWQDLGLDEEVNEELFNFLITNPMKITKKYNNKYYLDDAFILFISKRFKDDYKTYFNTISKQISMLKNIEPLSALDFSNLGKEISTEPLENLLREIEKIIQPTTVNSIENADGTTTNKEVPAQIPEENKVLFDEIKEKIEEIREAMPLFCGYSYDFDFISDFTKTLLKRLPEIIFFSSFEDILEFQFPIEELETKKINVDLCNLANIDIAKIKSLDDFQRRLNYLSTKSATISAKFKTDWLQDEINIKFNTEDKVIQFGIQEENDTSLYRAEQRSKGFQWFLSFYIRLNAQDSINKIILVDEPGLYLHAKAQEDVLKVFEKMANENIDSKVVISTHSPYLIDIDHLDRILLVEKDKKEGTKITKSHSKSKQETLTPILTKMGFDISKSALIKNKNVLLEGISDYYYLKAFEAILGLGKESKDIALIPSVGATQVPQLASLCIGWGLDYVALFDNDAKGQSTAKLMDKEFGEFSKHIFICNEADCAIEDLFSKDVFNQYVLDEKQKNNDEGVSNSKFIKTKKLNKVLLAKLFYDNAKKQKSKINIDANTKKKFEYLYSQLFQNLGITIQAESK